jgi:hypothetical protein
MLVLPANWRNSFTKKEEDKAKIKGKKQNGRLVQIILFFQIYLIFTKRGI